MWGSNFFTEKAGRHWNRLPRVCGCLIPGDIQHQTAWGPGQPGLVPNLVVDNPANHTEPRVGIAWPSRSLPTHTILWPHESHIFIDSKHVPPQREILKLPLEEVTLSPLYCKMSITWRLGLRLLLKWWKWALLNHLTFQQICSKTEWTFQAT